MKEKMSILGCGWLGLPLAKHLVGHGMFVKGSTTQHENFSLLKSAGVEPYKIYIKDSIIEAENLDSFLDSSVLIVNFPPERRPDIEDFHFKQASLLLNAIKLSPIEKVIFVSSTSVYPDVNEEVDENTVGTPAKGSGRALLLVEQLFINDKTFKTTVLRLAGLIGEDRLPARFLAGKTDLKNGNAPVNLIHRDDCIEIIYQIIKQEAWGEVFNACSEHHPSRKEYYVRAAKNAGLEVPIFSGTANEPASFKLINAEKLKKKLGYKFKYSSPMDII